jgi:molecular chaperone DnaJ
VTKLNKKEEKKKAMYDQYGSTGPGMGGGAYGDQGFGGFDFSGFGNAQGFDMGDLGDIFGDIFGGGMSRGKMHRKGQDEELVLDLSFEESILGTSKTILVEKQSKCDTCNGTGAKPGTKMSTCKDCSGSGQVKEIKRSILGSFATTRTCANCHGTGETADDKCGRCRGDGAVRRKDEGSIRGIIDTDLLEICRDRLVDFQNGPFANKYNAEALIYVTKALESLNQRIEDREARNVLGKNIQ